MVNESSVRCLCGGYISAEKYKDKKHFKTSKHLYFVENGIPKPVKRGNKILSPEEIKQKNEYHKRWRNGYRVMKTLIPPAL